MILTGPFQLLAYRNGVVDRVETEQLACRMLYIFFNQPTHGSLNQPQAEELFNVLEPLDSVWRAALAASVRR